MSFILINTFVQKYVRYSVSTFASTQLVFSYSLYFHFYCYKTIPVIDEVDASVEDSVVVVEESDVDANAFSVKFISYTF